MIILHASASDGRLLLWGETSTQEPEQAAPRPAPKPSARAARSRFALEAYRLVDAVATEIPGSGLSRARRQSAVAWLPSNDDGALPSSPLLTEQPADAGTVRIAPWEVPALAMTTEQAIEILAACKGRPTLGAGGDRRQDADLLGDGPPVRRHTGRAPAVSPGPGRGGRRHRVPRPLGAGAGRRSPARGRAAGAFHAACLSRAGR